MYKPGDKVILTGIPIYRPANEGMKYELNKVYIVSLTAHNGSSVVLAGFNESKDWIGAHRLELIPPELADLSNAQLTEIFEILDI